MPGLELANEFAHASSVKGSVEIMVVVQSEFQGYSIQGGNARSRPGFACEDFEQINPRSCEALEGQLVSDPGLELRIGDGPRVLDLLEVSGR